MSISRLMLAAFALPLTLAAQTAPVPQSGMAMGTPPDAGSAFVPERLARIDSWLTKLVADGQIPGAVAMLVRDGRVAYHKAFGVRDVGTGAALRTDDLFRIASQTKAITSTAVMMLWEEGRFSLDDPIDRYLPAFRSPTVLTRFNPEDSSFEARPTTKRITIRQLLTHTSGINYADIGSTELRSIYAKAGLTALGRQGDVLAEKIDVLGRLPLTHEPGEKFTYSMSVDVLGRLVEVLSGMSLDEFFRTRIFEPLGMKDTYFSVPAEKQSRVVALHQMENGKLAASHGQTSLAFADYPLRKQTYFAGGAGLTSTTADYARFLQMYLNGGELNGRRLLGRKTIELMLTNQIGNLEPPFGLGFQLETAAADHRSIVSEGTFSWGGAFNTTYWADPKERLIGLIFTNTTGNGPPRLGDPFKVFAYAALK